MFFKWLSKQFKIKKMNTTKEEESQNQIDENNPFYISDEEMERIEKMRAEAIELTKPFIEKADAIRREAKSVKFNVCGSSFSIR